MFVRWVWHALGCALPQQIGLGWKGGWLSKPGSCVPSWFPSVFRSPLLRGFSLCSGLWFIAFASLEDVLQDVAQYFIKAADKQMRSAI